MRDRLYMVLVLAFIALLCVGAVMISPAPTPPVNYQATPMSRPGGP